MKSLSKTDKETVSVNSDKEAKVSIEIYHKTDAAMRAITAEDLSAFQQNDDDLSQCVTVNIRIDKKVHEWLTHQRSNYHLAVNDILSEAMQKDLDSKNDA